MGWDYSSYVWHDKYPWSPPPQALWWKPKRWNEGEFDAVYVDKGSGLVRFVQLTVPKQHSFQIEYFYHILENLSQQMNELTLEIYFLSPTGTECRISNITGEGLVNELISNKRSLGGWVRFGRVRSVLLEGMLARVLN